MKAAGSERRLIVLSALAIGNTPIAVLASGNGMPLRGAAQPPPPISMRHRQIFFSHM
jgi:hypothetical protein